jgi:hypothetical protein
MPAAFTPDSSSTSSATLFYETGNTSALASQGSFVSSDGHFVFGADKGHSPCSTSTFHLHKNVL